MKNYYIQGNKDKADQIKAAFEKLGVASNANRYNYKNDYVLYFSAGGMMHMIDANGSWANIIKTHPDYKELELPVQPKFKVGDKVIYHGKECTITFMDDNFYDFDGGRSGCRIEKQDELLSPAPKPHYDIKNFKPFQKVLVRDADDGKWMAAFYSHYMYEEKDYPYQFATIGTDIYGQCIPFEGNEHLIGTTDMCAEQYINW